VNELAKPPSQNIAQNGENSCLVEDQALIPQENFLGLSVVTLDMGVVTPTYWNMSLAGVSLSVGALGSGRWSVGSLEYAPRWSPSQRSNAGVWRKYAGFLDLDTSRYTIQRRYAGDGRRGAGVLTWIPSGTRTRVGTPGTSVGTLALCNTCTNRQYNRRH